MKFCPNCGSQLEEKLKCNCGYDVKTGKIDEKEYYDFKEKSLYEQSCDNMNIFSNEKILSQLNQPIFNKDNDNLYGKEIVELMKYKYEHQEK